MNDLEIRYRYFNNADSEARVRELLEPLRFLIPAWVRLLMVDKYGERGGYVMEIEPNKAYRHASLTVYDRYFAMERREMRRMMIHEIIHLHHDPINLQVASAIIPFVEKQNPDLAEEFLKEYNGRKEGFVEDFSYVIEALLPSPDCLSTKGLP